MDRVFRAPLLLLFCDFIWILLIAKRDFLFVSVFFFFAAASESQNLPKQPPLMLALGQATECVQLMARVRSGSCSFARVDNFLH